MPFFTSILTQHNPSAHQRSPLTSSPPSPKLVPALLRLAPRCNRRALPLPLYRLLLRLFSFLGPILRLLLRINRHHPLHLFLLLPPLPLAVLVLRHRPHDPAPYTPVGRFRDRQAHDPPQHTNACAGADACHEALAGAGRFVHGEEVGGGDGGGDFGEGDAVG